MKFPTVFSFLALTGTALSAAINACDISVIIGVINDINLATEDHDRAVKAFIVPDVSRVISTKAKLDSAFTVGTKKILSTGNLSLTESVSIQGAVQNLQSSTEELVKDVISAKSALVSSNLGGAILVGLQSHLTAAKALSSAYISKLPSEVRSLGEELSAGIKTALQKGIDAFATEAPLCGQ